jgi:transcriptional regulator with XRE-family HTH domain
MRTPNEILLESYGASAAQTQSITSLQRGPADALKAAVGSGVFVFLLFAGTAGVISSQTVRTPFSAQTPRTGATYNIQCGGAKSTRREAEGSEQSDIVSETASQLVFIQRTFSMNTSEVANALNVSRPTVYAWLSGKSVRHYANLTRLQTLFELADFWRSISTHPLGEVLRRNPSQRVTLLLSLAAETVDSQNCRAQLQTLQTADANRTVRKSIRERLREYGVADRSIDAGSAAIEEETGL